MEKMSGVKIIGGGGGKKSYNGVSDIPSGSRKMVQSLKEIVNCPEAEIYAVLKDCNMDPNEAVNRLLSQDPFHEVKSKKDKKKEVRDIQDSRQRGYSNTYNRGTRGGSDRYPGPRRTGATSFNSSESGSFQGKTTNKRESEKQTYGGSFSSTSGVSSHQQIPHSDAVAVESKTPTVSSGGGIPSSQPVSVQQTAWFGAAGQMSMADIVKMGRPHNKTTNFQKNVSEVNQEHETAASQHVAVKDQWPSIEKPTAASTSSVSVAPTESVRFNGPADFQSSGGDQQLKGHLEDSHLAENVLFGNLGSDHVQVDTVAGGVVPEDESEVLSEFDDSPDGHQTQNHPVEHQKDEDNVSSVAANLQELSIENHDKSHEDRPAVLIPDHLLVYTEECSQLSFGSFGSRPLNNNLEEASDVAPQIERADARDAELYGDEQLGSTSHGNMVHPSNAENYDDSSESQQEVLLPENPETAHQQNQYSFAQSDQEYAYENAKQQTAFDASQTSIQNQMQNLASLTNVMQGYANATPNTQLTQTAQSARELELQYSTFPGGQSMPSRSNDYSLSDQSISMPEALRDGGGIQTTQPSQQQNLPGANVATGPALPQGPQQLPMHPYSQHSVPLTHFANMISYPLMPQGYPYMPSAFQQAFSGNSSYHQSPAALLPQYKNNISPSNLPPSATSAPISSAYGFGNSGNAGAGNFSLNQQQQQAAPTGATLSYEDVMSLQYKQNHLLSLQQQQQQQNENSPVWLHGPGSQTMSGAQSNAYYNLQVQQQAQQLRQAQQQAQQQYGSLGYPNYYQSQTGMAMDHQQRNPREGGSQGQASKQTPQQHLWQNSY